MVNHGGRQKILEEILKTHHKKIPKTEIWNGLFFRFTTSLFFEYSTKIAILYSLYSYTVIHLYPLETMTIAL